MFFKLSFMIKKLETTDLITIFNALTHVIVMQNLKLYWTTVITNLIYSMHTTEG